MEELLKQFSIILQKGMENLPPKMEMLIEEFGRYKMIIGTSQICGSVIGIILAYVFWKCKTKHVYDDNNRMLDEDAAIVVVVVTGLIFLPTMFLFWVGVGNIAAGIAPYGYLLNGIMK